LLGGDEPRESGRRDPLADLLPPMSGEHMRSEPRPSEALAESTGGFFRQEEDAEERDPTGRMRRANQTRAQMLEPAEGAGMSGGAAAPRVSVRVPGATSPVVSSSPRSRVVGFLISYDADENGEVFELRAGRWLLTSRPTDHGDYILVDDESISPLHAIIRATKEGVIQVLDQLSEFGSAVTKAGSSDEEEITGSMVKVAHGDCIRFGERRFIVCLIPGEPPAPAAE
ncbi:MAG: FHA domain-containing protein, partial [Bdellovibrionales bacterium]|nr:FHA domain-containing protein [Bdellovibrionales bacterium]